MSELRLDWATHDAAKFACVNWHYAGILPTGKLVKVGVWEDGSFKGVVLFSRGASPFLGHKYDLDHTEVCELTRVALRDHDAPVTKIVAIAIRFLKKSNPGLRLIVSFADPGQGHHGGIYQAGNWVYTGESNPVTEFFIRGRWRHMRGSYHEARAAGDSVPSRVMPGKYRYEMALDPDMRDLVELRRRPYPTAS